MTDPVVSVVIAAYNGATLIGETLRSLTDQSFSDFEVLVVDDGSTDETRAIVGAWPDPRVRLIALERNGGPVRARNRAVAEARGRYIAGLDQDDLCLPDRLARQVAYLGAHSDCVLVASAADDWREQRRRPSAYAPVSTPALLAWLTWIENPLVWSTVMVRTSAARALEPFTRPDYLYAEDFDLYHRIQRLGRIARIDCPLLLYRRHAGGASRRFTETMLANAKRVLAEAHAERLGDRAERVAGLLAEHMMGKRPASDRATLRALGDGIATLQAAFFREVRCTPTDARLIRWETALRWARIGRAGLRAGTIGLKDLIAVRPDHLGLGYAAMDTLVGSALVGTARRTRQTLAEKIIRPDPSDANT